MSVQRASPETNGLMILPLHFCDENERFDRELRAAHIPHVFAVYGGGHAQRVWAQHAASWLGLALNLARPR